MINYNKLHFEQISNLNHKPTLLAHVCCGACSMYPLIYLSKFFKLTIYFTNSNIYPQSEFENRLNTLIQYLNIINDNEIKLVIDDYNYNEYEKDLSYFKDEKEGGKRCYLCYKKRIEKSFIFATNNNFEYVTTIMSISSRKNSNYINEIGTLLNKKYKNVRFLYADFKKNNGIIENERLNKQHNLYKQDYCGCRYSIYDKSKT